MTHRGPDSSGSWFDDREGIGLTHRRLSIIDLSEAGHQPMVSPGGRFVVTYNGEVYNFPDLRSQLEDRGHGFRGHSDTEVILAAFEEWGIQSAIEKFVGMFALGTWDRERRELILVRDRLGIKPLYVGFGPDKLAFASQISPLERALDRTLEIDRNAVACLLRDNYIPAPLSIYREISKVPPGHVLRLDRTAIGTSRLPKPEPYWSATSMAESGRQSPFRDSPNEAVDLLEDRLTTAVADRLVADVPVGAFLSGGVDSSTITAIMQSVSSRQVRTFSIGFHEEAYDEAGHARAIAEHLGTDHRELYVSAEEARAVIPRLPELYDEPFADSSQIPTFLVSRLARQDVKVALSGDGGDELFSGYDRYRHGMDTWRKIGWIPERIRKALSAGAFEVAGQRDGGAILDHLRLGPERGTLADEAFRVADLLSASSPIEAYRATLSHWIRPHELVLGADEDHTFSWADIGTMNGDFTSSMMLVDLLTYLPDDILVKLDRASMAVSLEARVPLLDHRVVETALSFPLSLKVRDGMTKWVLRQVLQRHVPPSMFDRPKAGFSVPVDRWLRGPLESWGESLLSADRLAEEGFLRPGPVRKAWRHHQAGIANNGERLWPVLMFQAWLESAPAGLEQEAPTGAYRYRTG